MMSFAEYATYREIKSKTAAWAQAMTGRAARTVPGGELLLNPQMNVEWGTVQPHVKNLLVAINRSGTTTDVVVVQEKCDE
jgi:fructoselysine-6-P-deglycase FrlB-like protein